MRRTEMDKVSSAKEYDLLIIGGGPAGLTAAAYAIRKRLETMLLGDLMGGRTNHKFCMPGVETHQIIDGEELISKFRSEIEYLDFARHVCMVTKFQRVGKRFVAESESRTFKGKAAIIATGLTPRLLEVPGAREFMGRGVSYSTISHALVFIDMDVAVVGNGMRALQATAELVRIARKVNLIGVPSRLLSSTLGQKIKASGRAEFFTGYDVKEIRGKDSPEKIVVKSKTDEMEIRVSGVFVELGYTPNTSLFSHLVKMDKEGRILIDENNQTNVPGLFAAGDATDINANQVVIAIGEGANAALNAYNYLLTFEE
jgi:NADH-dependent peroxiredoxin subunit F